MKSAWTIPGSFSGQPSAFRRSAYGVSSPPIHECHCSSSLDQDGVLYDVAPASPGGPRNLSPHPILRRVDPHPRRPEPQPRLDAEQVAQRKLPHARLRATLIDQPLRARDRARRREQLDPHVGETLERLLALDDLALVRPDRPVRRGGELGDVLLEVLPVIPQPLVEIDI